MIRAAARPNVPGWKVLHSVADRRVARFRKTFLEALRTSRYSVSLLDIENAMRSPDELEQVLHRALSMAYALLRVRAVDLLQETVIASARAMRGEAKRRGTLRSAQTVSTKRKELKMFSLRVTKKRPDPLGKMDFNLLFPEAERWANEHGAKLIQDISKATRAAIAEVISESFSVGWPADQSARMIRSMIGLTEQQAQAVINLGDRMRESPGEKIYAGNKAIRVPEDVDEELITERMQDYADDLLYDRADRIARTETIDAANEGQEQLWDQAVESGLLDDTVMREWIITPDDRLCDECAELEGELAPLRGEFAPGVDGPPLHPDCRCAQGISAETEPREAAEFNEEDHPRDETGKFTDGGGSGSLSSVLEKHGISMSTAPMPYPSLATNAINTTQELLSGIKVPLDRNIETDFLIYNNRLFKSAQQELRGSLEQRYGKDTPEYHAAYKEIIDTYAAHQTELMNSDDTFYDSSRTAFLNDWKESSTTWASTQAKFAIADKFNQDVVVYDPSNHGRNDLAIAHERALVDRMYRETQEELKTVLKKGEPDPSKGWDGEKLSLSRGVQGKITAAGAIESWTSSETIASKFGTRKDGLFAPEQVLTSHLSTNWRKMKSEMKIGPGKGIGQYKEKEFIIIRNPKTEMVRDVEKKKKGK